MRKLNGILKHIGNRLIKNVVDSEGKNANFNNRTYYYP